MISSNGRTVPFFISTEDMDEYFEEIDPSDETSSATYKEYGAVSEGAFPGYGNVAIKLATGQVLIANLLNSASVPNFEIGGALFKSTGNAPMQAIYENIAFANDLAPQSIYASLEYMRIGNYVLEALEEFYTAG